MPQLVNSTQQFTSQETSEFTSRLLYDQEISLKKDLSYPKICIVTPSHNQSEFLERTILSVLNQNYPNLEYIIIDGGSSDKSVEIIKKYERFLSYWVSEPDQGQAHAINKGFSKSTGEILAYINSDDTYNPGAFLTIARTFTKTPENDLVFGNINLVDKQDNLIGDVRYTQFHFETFIYEGGSLHQSASFWTKDLYDKIGGFSQEYRFCMDFDFFCRAAASGNFKHISQHIANFRCHDKSKSSRIGHIGCIEHEKIAAKYRKSNSNSYIEYKRRLCQARRFLFYLVQGDIDYAIRGLYRRLTRRENELRLIPF